MDREELTASKRTVLGKKVRFLRRQGLTPGNLYGAKTNSVALQIETPFLERFISRVGKNALIMLKIDGESSLAMVRDLDWDPLNDRLLHVDFYRVDITQKIKVEVPIVFVGHSPVERSSRLVMLHNLSALHIEALPGNLPKHIEVDISPLTDANQSIHVRDISVDDGITVLTDPNEIIVQVQEGRVEVEEVKPAAVEGVEAEAEAEEAVVPAADEKAGKAGQAEAERPGKGSTKPGKQE